MADAFRGLTLRIGADARPVNSAINSIKASAGAAQKQLNAMEKALRFDGNNASVLASKLDLVSDQARLSANALSKITLATRQAAGEAVRFSEKSGLASGKLEEVAGKTKEVYSAVQRINSEFNTTNAQLQRIYDAAARLAGYKRNLDSAGSNGLAETIARLNGVSFGEAVGELQRLRAQMKGAGEDAESAKSEYARLLNQFSDQDGVNYIKRLREQTRGSGEAATAARIELEKYVRQAAGLKSVANGFDIQRKDAESLVGIWKRLQAEHNALQGDLASIKRVEGFRALQIQAVSFKSSVAQSSAELARTRAQLAALGTTGQLAAPLSSMKLLGGYAESATANAKRLQEAFSRLDVTDGNVEAKVRALKQAEAAVNAELEQTQAAMAAIRKDPAWDAQAAKAANAYVNAAKTENQYAQLAAEATIAEERVKTLNEAVSMMRSGKIDQAAESFRQFKAVLSSLGYSDDEIAGITADTSRLKAALKEAQTAASALGTQLATLDDKHATASLIMQMKSLETAEAGAKAKLAELEASTKHVATAIGGMRTAGYGFYSTITPIVMMAGRYAIQAADEVDSAYRNMRKTVNGTEAEFESLRESALEFGRTHYTSASQILEIEAIGGQLGIQAKNLAKFAEVVANLDIATNLDTETISENLGQLANIMDDMSQGKQTGPGSLESFSDALVRLGNNSATQEDKIMSVMMRIASMGNVCDMTTPDLLALSTAVAASGQGSEAAGTAISRTFSNIESAVNSGGEKLSLFAETSGMTVEEFKRKWSESPMEVFTAFVNGLERVDEAGGSVDGTLTSLSITGVRQKQTLMNLTTQTNVLADALEMSSDAWNGVDDEWGDAGDAAREASRKMEGFSGQLQLLKNAGQELGVEMLDGLTPVLKGITGFVQAVTGVVSALPDGMKTAIAGVAVAFAALGPAAVGINSIMDVARGFKGVMSSFKESKVYASVLQQLAVETEAASAAMGASTVATEANTAANQKGVVAKARNTAATIANAVASRTGAAAIEAEGAAATATSAGVSKATKAIAVMTLTMKAVPFVAVTAAVMAFASAIGSAMEHAERFRKSTDGMKDAVRGLVSATDAEAGSLSGLDGEVSKNTKSFSEFLESQAEVADEMNATVSEMQSSIAPLNSAAAIIEEYAGKTGLTMEEQYRLRAAIESVNGSCDTQYKIVDAANGAISDSTGAYKEAAAANGAYKSQILDTIEAQKKQIQASAYDDVLKKADAAKAEAEIQYQTILEKRKKLLEAGADTTVYDIMLNDAKNALDAATESADTTALAYGKVKAGMDEAGESAEGTAESIEAAAQAEAEAAEELESSLDTLDKLTEKFPALSSMLSGLDLETFVQKLDDAGITMDEFSSGVQQMADNASDGFNRIEADSEMSIDTYIENLKRNRELMEEWGTNLGKLGSMSSDTQYQSWISELREAGPEQASFIAELANADKETVMQAYQAWADAAASGSTAYAESMSNVVSSTQEATLQIEEQAQSLKDRTDALGEMGITYKVSDEGTVTIAESRISELDRQTLAKKGFIVTDNGTVLDMRGKCDSLNAITINGKTFYVTDNGTVYDTEGKLANIENALNDVPSTKEIKVSALTDNAQTTLGKLNTYLKSMSSSGTSTTLNVNTSKATSAASGLKSAISAVPSTYKTTFSSNAANVKTGIKSLESAIRDVPATKTISIFRNTYDRVISSKQASGGVLPAHARGALVPAHASGGINGIVTRATMTNVGWVGEAGAEAVFNMRHAGGAIVPLTNRRYVRPFANAVASEMGGGRSISAPITINMQGTSVTADDVAEAVASSLNRISLMGA